jgi:carbonic anhydrase/acetyltransferase-like protein (isoleucine patch superfamily)
VNGLLSAFAKPLVHQPPEVYQPFRLFVIRVLRRLLGLLPQSWIEKGSGLAAFSTRLKMGDLRRTDGLAHRVERARQMGMKVGEGCRLYSLHVRSEGELVQLGDNVIVSGEVMFITHDGSIYTALEKFPDVNGHYGRIRVGNNCFIGMRATIMPGVELGDRCVVAAGAVVMDSFPANSVIAGNPAIYVCPTSMYMELKKHSPATMYDSAYGFPLKMPPDLLAARMADVPFKVPRRKMNGDQSRRTLARDNGRDNGVERVAAGMPAVNGTDG